jgi:tetratricopeptide (TPR) repeat protein
VSEEAEPHLVRTGHEDWFRLLDLERGNLRRGMAWTIERGEAVLALRYTVALWRYWRQLGEFAEGRRWSDQALAVAGDPPPSLRAKALWAASALAFPQGDHARMAEMAAEAIELAGQSEDPMDLRNALTIIGMVAMLQGRYADALGPYGEGVAICSALGISWQLGTSHLNFATALLHSGRIEEAVAGFEQALRVYREIGDDIFAARVLNHLAQAALAGNEIARAERLAREALTSVAEQGELLGIVQGLETLAGVAAVRSEVERAAALAGAAAAIRETIASRAAPFDVAISGRLLARIQSSGSEKRWRRAWDRGRALDSAAAISFALAP